MYAGKDAFLHNAAITVVGRLGLDFDPETDRERDNNQFFFEHNVFKKRTKFAEKAELLHIHMSRPVLRDYGDNGAF